MTTHASYLAPAYPYDPMKDNAGHGTDGVTRLDYFVAASLACTPIGGHDGNRRTIDERASYAVSLALATLSEIDRRVDQSFCAVSAQKEEQDMTKDIDHMPELPSPVLDGYWRGGVEIVRFPTESALREIVEQAHMSGQISAGIDPSYSNAQQYCATTAGSQGDLEAKILNLQAENKRLRAALSEVLGHADYFSKMFDDCVVVMGPHDEDRCDRLYDLRKILHNSADTAQKEE